ncbi:hypothetical protein Tco_0360090 [Tanacetum coccineum]
MKELTVNDPPPSSFTPSSSSPKPKLSTSQHILSLFKPKTGHFKRYKSFFDELQGRYRYLFEHLKTRFMPRKKFHVLAPHLQEIMEESLPKMVDTRLKELTKTQVPIYVAQGLIMERQQSQADVAKMIADAIQQECENLRAEISSQINNAISNHTPSQVDSSVINYMSGHIFHVHPTQANPASAQEQQYQLYLTMKDNPQLQQDDLPIWLVLKYKFERLHMSDTPCRPFVVRPRDQDDPHDDAHPEGENSTKRKKTTEHGTYVFGESSSGQLNESEPCPSTSDLLYLKKGNSGPAKIVMSLHKFPAVIFLMMILMKELPDSKEKKEPIKFKGSRSTTQFKIVQIIKTYWELGHEHKFITKIIARRANGSIVSIIESDYKNFNKNDIKDIIMQMLTASLSKEDAEYLQLFEEEIEERLKHRDQEGNTQNN